MNWDLYKKYGEYNRDNYYIENHDKWHYYSERPKLYRKKKIIAWIYLCTMPIVGIIIFMLIFEEMGLGAV
jgi:hypothetical protein